MDFDALRNRAMKRDIEAQVELGKHLLKRNTPHDNAEAEKWLKRAALKKHPEALFQMGIIRLEALEAERACHYFEKAYKKGMKLAAKYLAMIYRGDIDPSIHDEVKANTMMLNYYRYDRYDALEPLINQYTPEGFKPTKETKTFLEEAKDYGLLKAKYHLAMLHLTVPKFKDLQKAVHLLESYFEATADTQAARVLYQLYAPGIDTYADFKATDAKKAAFYLKHTIDEGADVHEAAFIKHHDVYLPHDTSPLEPYIDHQLERMRRSLAADADFAESVNRDDFSTQLHYHIETIVDYDATITYRIKEVTEDVVEREVEKKRVVKKGFKKTGTVKVPERITKVKKHKQNVERTKKIASDQNIERLHHYAKRIDDFPHLVETTKAHNASITFDQPLEDSAVKAMVENTIKTRFKKPRKARRVKREFTFSHAIRLRPIAHISHAFLGRTYAIDVPLTNSDLPNIPFPLDKGFAQTLRKFTKAQRATRRNHQFAHLMLALGPAWFVHQLFHHLTLSAWLEQLHTQAIIFFSTLLLSSIFSVWLYKKIPFKRIEADAFITYYDDNNIEALKPKRTKQLLIIAIKFISGLAFFIAGALMMP